MLNKINRTNQNKKQRLNYLYISHKKLKIFKPKNLYKRKILVQRM